MNELLSLLTPVLARTTVWTLAAGLLTLLLLRLFRVRSARVERLAWLCVLCQGWHVWQYPIALPGMLETWLDHSKSAPAHLAIVPENPFGELLCQNQSRRASQHPVLANFEPLLNRGVPRRKTRSSQPRRHQHRCRRSSRLRQCEAATSTN
jgi:hypothetical protein